MTQRIMVKVSEVTLSFNAECLLLLECTSTPLLTPPHFISDEASIEHSKIQTKFDFFPSQSQKIRCFARILSYTNV